jgi:hypothetical protein
LYPVAGDDRAGHNRLFGGAEERSVRKVLVICAVCVALVAGWCLLVDRWHQSVQPVGHTLADQLAAMPELGWSEVFTFEDREYLAVAGVVEPYPRFPSGPPVYVFDRTGQLVDWTPDTGDDEEFHRRWLGSSGRRPVTRDEALRWPAARPAAADRR